METSNSVAFFDYYWQESQRLLDSCDVTTSDDLLIFGRTYLNNIRFKGIIALRIRQRMKTDIQ